jgi:hypothetical protein
MLKLWKAGKWVQFGWSGRKCGAMWLQNVATELCGALRYICLKIPTVSSVQVANVVDMSDRQSGRGCRSEQSYRVVGKRNRSHEECMGDGWCSILTRPWPRRPMVNLCSWSRVVLLAYSPGCSLNGQRIVVLFPARTSNVSLLRTWRPAGGQTQSACHSRGSSGRSVWLTAYPCSVSRFKNDGSLTSLTSTFRSVMVGCRVAVGRLVCSLAGDCRLNEM